MEYTPLKRRKNTEITSMCLPDGGWKCRNVNDEARIKSSRFLSRSTPQVTKFSKLSMHCRCSKTPPRLWSHSPGAQVLLTPYTLRIQRPCCLSSAIRLSTENCNNSRRDIQFGEYSVHSESRAPSSFLPKGTPKKKNLQTLRKLQIFWSPSETRSKQICTKHQTATTTTRPLRWIWSKLHSTFTFFFKKKQSVQEGAGSKWAQH